MPNAVIVEALRTPIGRFQGSLATVRPDDLAAGVIGAVVSKANVDPKRIAEVFFGCANQSGEDNRNVARMASLLAGLPQEVPAVTLNRLCASGLEAVNQATRMIKLGEARVAVAGGVESMSRAPYSMPRGPQFPKAGNVELWDTTLGWRYPNPKMEAMFPLEAMGLTAENILRKWPISRADQDAFALQSHQRALAAIAEGLFANEIVPVTLTTRRGSTQFDTDEGPRDDTSLEKLGKLAAAFLKGGSVTAGNSSTLNDGAAALVLADEDYAKREGLRIRARIRSMASAGVDPTVMGLGPIPASRKACENAGLEPADIDVWEINEAFAAQSLAVMRQLRLSADKVNLHGGAIALGHPLGCSGARILTTLLNIMEQRDLTLGCATLCVGVGQGVATIIERV